MFKLFLQQSYIVNLQYYKLRDNKTFTSTLEKP